jgi:hypothetical protein
MKVRLLSRAVFLIVKWSGSCSVIRKFTPAALLVGYFFSLSV